MTRATSALLVLAGTLLLATWLAAPATSAPQAAPRRVVPADAIPPPELDDVNAEVARLRSRLESRAAFPEPTRDPFHFGTRPRATRLAVAEPAPAPVVVEEAVVAWPTLVAILTSAADGTFQAAIADDDDALHVLAVGDKVAGFTVAEISADAVTLTEPTSGRSRQLSVH